MDRDQQHRLSSIGVDVRPPANEDLDSIQVGWRTNVAHDSLGNWAESARDLVLPSEEHGFSRVATVNDRVIGFASVIGGALRGIYVEDPYRRQGVGDALLRLVSGFAQEKGWKELTIATCHDWVGTIPGIDIRCETAISFLEHRGFETGASMSDLEADIQDVEAVSRQRPLVSCPANNFNNWRAQKVSILSSIPKFRSRELMQRISGTGH